jgi:hypothetical protein
MDENERGFGDVADSARAEDDVLQGASALGEQGETAFAETSSSRPSLGCLTGASTPWPAPSYPGSARTGSVVVNGRTMSRTVEDGTIVDHARLSPRS